MTVSVIKVLYGFCANVLQNLELQWRKLKPGLFLFLCLQLFDMIFVCGGVPFLFVFPFLYIFRNFFLGFKLLNFIRLCLSSSSPFVNFNLGFITTYISKFSSTKERYSVIYKLSNMRHYHFLSSIFIHLMITCGSAS